MTKRMATDPRRVEAMQNWSNLKSMKHVKGFVGMKGYYRWFIRNYGKSHLLTCSKGRFHWNAEAHKAFKFLKEALTAVLIQYLLNSLSLCLSWYRYMRTSCVYSSKATHSANHCKCMASFL